ncbi:hypothetical protein [Stenotrophomonas maltophilia group sp. LNF336]
MKMNGIRWPEGYLPGYTENFVSNELIVLGLAAADVWPLLEEPRLWPTYYGNSANVRFHDGAGPLLRTGIDSTLKPLASPWRLNASSMRLLPPRVRAGSLGMAGPVSPGLPIDLTFIMRGLSKTLMVAECGSSRRRRRRDSLQKPCVWPSRIQ